jgi:hypothetical protein
MTSKSRLGQSFEGHFAVAGSRVPLRPGAWVVLGELRASSPTSSKADYFLGHINKNNEMDEAVRIHSHLNDLGSEDRYPPLKLLDNELFNYTDSNEENGSQSAWVVVNAIATDWPTFRDKTIKMTPIIRAAAAELNRRQGRLHKEFLVVQFARREHGKLLHVSYWIGMAGVGPGPEGKLETWGDSALAPHKIRKYPEKFKRYQKIVDWANVWWPQFKTSFENFYPEGF